MNMDQFNLSLGKWLGVGVTIHWTWWITVILFGIQDTSNYILIPAVFFILILHELGHCMAARYFGSTVHGIMLYPMGGAAFIGSATTYVEELVVALAGPAVNFVLIPFFMMVAGQNEMLDRVGLCNLVLLIFNLIPAFPMDGGRVLRAVLGFVTGSMYRSTWWAVRVGQVFAVLFCIAGIMSGNFMLVLVGLFVFWYSGTELEKVKFRAQSQTDDSFDILRRARSRVDRIRRND